MSKILIVEDEPNLLRGLRDNLEFEGYETDSAEEGKTGLEKILGNPYDLVLLDVMLPHISGFDICKKARAANIDIPIILLTAKGEEIDKILGLELGADDYITKPFNLEEFLLRVKILIRRGLKGTNRENELDVFQFGSYKRTSLSWGNSLEIYNNPQAAILVNHGSFFNVVW